MDEGSPNVPAAIDSTVAAAPGSRPLAPARASNFFGLGRNVAAASAAVCLLGFGEELWKKFLPKYLEALGAGAGTVGLFGTARDFFDAVYQYPGGWIADRVGRRRAFLAFIALASVGYVFYLLSPAWPSVFVGLAFSRAWQQHGESGRLRRHRRRAPARAPRDGLHAPVDSEARAEAVAPLIGGR